MTMNLYQASRQWATRPDDERFWTVDDMLRACQYYKERAREAVVPANSLVAKVAGKDGADLELVGRAGNPARLTHWAFGQVSRYVGAPADYLRKLPVELVAVNLNHGLKSLPSDNECNLLLHQNGGLVLRSMTTDTYTRIWNADVVSRLQDFGSAGWRVPPARPARADQAGTRKATKADVLEGNKFGLSVKEGDEIAPAGLYASDHDMFVFMVNEKARINDGTEGGLSRGFFVENSEVGNGRALKVTTFFYRHCCGNHIVWDVSGVNELKIVHRGDADVRFQGQLSVELRKYAEGKASEDEAKILKAQKTILGKDREAVIDALFKALRGDVTRKALEAGYDRCLVDAKADKTLDPKTVWGVVNGITAYSQTLPYADERARLDRSASKILSVAF